MEMTADQLENELTYTLRLLSDARTASALKDAEIESLMRERVKWRDADNDPPLDEQRVLGGWFGTSCIEGMETLIYHATARDGSSTWLDVHGEERDPPTHWTLLAGPNKAAGEREPVLIEVGDGLYVMKSE